MNALRIAAIALLLPLAGCGQKPQQAGAGSASPATTALGSEVRQAMDKAKAELATKNIDINGVAVKVNGSHTGRRSDLPRAEITPQGGLLIDGKPVAVTPQQQALLNDYRGQLIGIAEAGMDIGAQGADLGFKAAGEALKAVLSGDASDAIEKRVEAQTAGIKAAAKRLCGRMPALLASQQRLAAAVPAFGPYATMQQSDIDDCAKDIDGENVAGIPDAKRTGP